jgi:hypothetical protein
MHSLIDVFASLPDAMQYERMSLRAEQPRRQNPILLSQEWMTTGALVQQTLPVQRRGEPETARFRLGLAPCVESLLAPRIGLHARVARPKRNP